MPDEIFEHPRLVAIYDALDPDRRDLDVYAAIAGELGVRRVLDVGCGTGTFALFPVDTSSLRPESQQSGRGWRGTGKRRTG